MSKFSNRPVQQTSAVATMDAPIYTHEGGLGHQRDPKSELFVLAVANMVGEGTFYENGKVRDARFVDLVHQVTRTDPDWLARFIPYLRDSMNMRSASVVAACEYVKAGGPHGRKVIDAACQRADEPAEVLGYWHSVHGRRVPKPVKRGVADAARRLYTERASLRYDGQSRGIRMADVLEITHPKPTADWQGHLFRHLIDRRHNRPESDGSPTLVNGEAVLPTLPIIEANKAFHAVPQDKRREYLSTIGSSGLESAGVSWEALSGWLAGPMDAQAWEAAIPSMGYMALLRNLNNFDKAGISDELVGFVKAKLSDPEQVAKSRQFPLRFYSAWNAVDSLRWAEALERALNLSLANVPELDGRSLILIDVSGSMMDKMSEHSEAERWQIASIFGYALASRAQQADVAAFSSSSVMLPSASRMTSILRATDAVRSVSCFGQGTDLHRALDQWFVPPSTGHGHKRVIVITDEQTSSYGLHEDIPLVYTWNIAGYKAAALPSGKDGRHTFAGLSDSAFTMLSLLESRKDGGWPF